VVLFGVPYRLTFYEELLYLESSPFVKNSFLTADDFINGGNLSFYYWIFYGDDKTSIADY
jgi:hypothetical protein